MQEMQETGVPSWGQEDPMEKEMATDSSILAWESHGQKNLAGYSPWGHNRLDTTKQQQSTKQQFMEGWVRPLGSQPTALNWL